MVKCKLNFAVLDSRTFWTIKGAKNIGSARHHFKWQNYLTFLTLVWDFSKIHQVSNEKFLPFFNQSETIVHFGQAVLLTFDLISWKKILFCYFRLKFRTILSSYYTMYKMQFIKMSYKKLEFRKGSSNSSFHFYSIQMHFDLDVNLFYFCRYMIDIFFFRDGWGFFLENAF